jgi:NAD(P)-dependent dehydrogenase (short-subunit alcohol dehydrogenase family)
MTTINELFSLKGKVAIVTGGGRGIGKYIATGLAEVGANIVIGSRKLENCEQVAKALEKMGVRTLAVRCDMGKIEDIDNLVEATMRVMGGINILVNNAGITWGAPTLDFPIEKWEKVMAVNVRGTFLLSQRVGKVMIKQGGGKIINISSVSGLSGSPEEVHPAIAYSTSKGAIISLTRDLAVKWAKFNIQVNAIAPAFFETDMMAWLKKDRFKTIKKHWLEEVIPMGRSGKEDDIKGVGVFLASGASNFITGEVICVDGGQLAK